MYSPCLYALPVKCNGHFVGGIATCYFADLPPKGGTSLQVYACHLPITAYLSERHVHRTGPAISVCGCAREATLVVIDAARGETPTGRLL